MRHDKILPILWGHLEFALSMLFTNNGGNLLIVFLLEHCFPGNQSQGNKPNDGKLEGKS